MCTLSCFNFSKELKKKRFCVNFSDKRLPVGLKRKGKGTVCESLWDGMASCSVGSLLLASRAGMRGGAGRGPHLALLASPELADTHASIRRAHTGERGVVSSQFARHAMGLLCSAPHRAAGPGPAPARPGTAGRASPSHGAMHRQASCHYFGQRACFRPVYMYVYVATFVSSLLGLAAPPQCAPCKTFQLGQIQIS